MLAVQDTTTITADSGGTTADTVDTTVIMAAGDLHHLAPPRTTSRNLAARSAHQQQTARVTFVLCLFFITSMEILRITTD
jgi:hypothetical protein